MPTILVVDSEPFTRDASVGALQRAGHDVREAATARHAEHVVVAARPHMILLDTHLPDRSGFEVCRELKSNPATRGIVVVMKASGHERTEDRQRALAAGADEYLESPLSAELLIETVQRLLA